MFNLLVPVKTITQISPLHKVSINTVEVSKDMTGIYTFRTKTKTSTL